MKRAVKTISIFFGCILALHLTNRTYFRYNEKKYKGLPRPTTHDYFYTWRFGDIHYRVTGKGQPLLLIHGIYPGANINQWRDIDMSVFKSNRIYCMDLLGFGRSEKPNLAYNAYLYIRLINDFIKDVIQEPTIIAATDYSAAYAVMGYFFDAALYKKLILISPSGMKDSYTLPSLKDYIAKLLMELPVLSTSVYILLFHKMNRSTLITRLWHKLSIASRLPKVVHPLAFVGGANCRLPISALLSKFLNVKIKDKFIRIKIPYIVLSNKYYRLSSIEESRKIRKFLNS